MGLYEAVNLDVASPLVPCVANARTYTLYSRGKRGLWYVNFIYGGRQIRVSTGLTDGDSAKALIESYRNSGWQNAPLRKVSDKHLYRMIERCRYRNRRKQIPFSLGINDLKAIFERCRGYCEVTGRPLDEDGPFRPSLDRIDPKAGYTPGNVRIVCLVTNTAMLHYGEAAFGEIAIAYCQKMGILSSPTPPST